MGIVPDWNGLLVALIVFVTVLTIQRTRWGMRVTTKQGLKDLLADLITDELWKRYTDGKITAKRFTQLTNEMSEMLDLTQLKIRSASKLKAEIKRRLKTTDRSSPWYMFYKKKPNIPGEKPLQDIAPSYKTVHDCNGRKVA